MKKKRTQKKNTQMVLGWREWVSLPDLKVKTIKAKVDSGARTSALHAENIRIVSKKNGLKIVSFDIFPKQRNRKTIIHAKAEVVETRKVKSSTGKVTYRPVIHTAIKIGEVKFDVELTLINRDMMGFRMLLGRQALRNKFMINPAASFTSKK